MNFKRVPTEQCDIARRVFNEGHAFGVSGIRIYGSRRVHCGYDESAWSKPKLVIYGAVEDQPAVLALASGWTGEIEFQSR